MIKRLKYSDIDFAKYERCLENSVQRNFYAKREILDHLCENWELLILNDYEFVMPVPLKTKMGVNFVLMPLFCQQLGVFGIEKNAEIEQQFLLFLNENYRAYTYQFNFQNSSSKELATRKNYVIQPTEYSLLRKKYSKGRKADVRSSQHLTLKEIPLAENENCIVANFKGLEKKSEREKFRKYLQFLNQSKLLKIFGAFKDENLISVTVTIDSKEQISLLALISDNKFLTEKGASFLVDRILQANISDKTFDFMGGNMRGTEVFFKGFGAELQLYPTIQRSRKDLLLNFFGK